MAGLRCGNGMLWSEESSGNGCQGVSSGGGDPCRFPDEVDRKRKRKAVDSDSESDEWSWSSDDREECEDREREVPVSPAVYTSPAAAVRSRSGRPPPPRPDTWRGVLRPNRSVDGGGTSSSHPSSCLIVILDDSSSDEEEEEGDEEVSAVPPAVHSSAPATTARPALRADASSNDRAHISTSWRPSAKTASRCYIDLLSGDLLSVIFSRIDADTDEVFRTVPFVCRSWNDACFVDTVDFTQYRHRARGHVDVAVRSVTWRCRHHLRRLIVPGISHEALDYVFWTIPCLKLLKIPYSPVPDDVFLIHSHCLGHLTGVDLSHCTNITAHGIAALGMNSPCLVRFVRRLRPIPPAPGAGAVDVDDGEPMAIAETMSALEFLALESVRISGVGVRAIVENCGSLRYIDLTGCLGLGDDEFWSRMRDVTSGLMPTAGFRRLPVVMNVDRFYLYPIE